MNRISERNRRMKSMFGAGLEAPATEIDEAEPARPKAAGAIRSMQSSFSAIEAENERLREQLESNSHVVELDPDVVLPSFVIDRFAESASSAELAPLVESIRETGQLIPILVRPDPQRTGFFQVAYGHRRWRACQELKRPVRAVVSQLSDQELVVAQGKENAERRNLSFIEQAVFAATLKDAKFPRETIAASLALPETNVSKMISVAKAIPRAIVEAIGPAPKVGRPRWESLADLCGKASGQRSATAVLSEVRGSDQWQSASSDDRFAIFQQALAGKRDQPHREVKDQRGQVIARVKTGRRSTQIIIDDRELAELLVQHLSQMALTADERRSNS